MKKAVRNLLKTSAFSATILCLSTLSLFAQNPCDFGNLNPFCTDDNPLGITYPSGTSGNASSFLGSTNAACLGSTPCAAWYYMRIDNPGNLLIYIEQYSGTTARDVDFACWGPFPTSDVMTFREQLCDGTYTLYTGQNGQPGGYPGSHRPTNGDHSNNQLGGWPFPASFTGNNIPMVDCSYNASNTEWCFMPNTQNGDIYLLLITNYSQQPAQISFNAVNASYAQATTDCSVLLPLESNAPICEGQVLTIHYPFDEASNITYNWTGPNNFSQTTNSPLLEIPDVNSNMSGYYRLVMVSGNRRDTVYSDSLIIVPKPQLSYNLQDGTYFCEGDTVNLVATVTNHDFVWFSVNGGQFSNIPSVSTTIPEFAIHDNTAFVFSAQARVGGAECTSLPDTIRLLCSRTSSGLIEDQICVGQTYNRYGFTLPIQNAPIDTLLEAYYENLAGCDSTSQVLLHVTANPQITQLQNDPEHCVHPDGSGHQDGNLIVSVSAFTNDLQYTWAPSPAYIDPDSLLNIHGGTYVLTVVDSFNCQSVQTFVVDALPNPVACFTLTPESPSYLVGENIVFNNCSQYQTVNYWNMGDNHTTSDFGVTYVYNDIGAYTITLDVEDDFGCSDHFEKTIEVHEKMRFYLPNSFTPNGDGVNDYFLPVQMEVKEDTYQIVIYDRWGNIVFTTRNLTEGWDGTVNGKLAEKGSIFTYFTTYKDYDDVLYEKRGTVTLIY